MDIYKEPESKGWEYPWAINKVCSTVKKGEFIAMVGNAGSGKTWYALYMSMFWAMRYGLKVFILSKEMIQIQFEVGWLVWSHKFHLIVI